MPEGESQSLDAEALEELQAGVRTRVRASQAGILTYFDKWLLEQHMASERTNAAERRDAQWIEGFAYRAAEGRFVRFAERTNESCAGIHGNGISGAASDIPDHIMRMSQGTQGPVRWRGLPLFKCAFDLALYTHLLDEMRPGSIFEIGSGTGASALWFADMCSAFGAPCRVVSLDCRPPVATHPSVTFVAGDCAAVADCMPETMLAEAPRPLLLIEDAHESVGKVLCHFAAHMKPGDRIVVEDSAGKQEVLGDFAKWTLDAFLVDTLYTDFFGYNATSAVNSFLIRC